MIYCFDLVRFTWPAAALEKCHCYRKYMEERFIPQYTITLANKLLSLCISQSRWTCTMVRKTVNGWARFYLNKHHIRRREACLYCVHSIQSPYRCTLRESVRGRGATRVHEMLCRRPARHPIVCDFCAYIVCDFCESLRATGFRDVLCMRKSYACTVQRAPLEEPSAHCSRRALWVLCTYATFAPVHWAQSAALERGA